MRLRIVVGIACAVFGILGGIVADELPLDEAAALDRLPGIDVQVQLEYRQTPLSQIMESLAASAPFTVTFTDKACAEYVTLDMKKQSLKQVLVALAARYDLAYEVPEKGHLVVGKRSRTKEAE